MKTTSTTRTAEVVGIAAGIAAVAASFYFFGKSGKAHRDQVSTWSKKAKTEMLAKIKKMKTVTKEAYDKAADEVVIKYKQIKNIDPLELQAFAKELKSHWDKISLEAKKLGNKTTIKKSTKK